MDFKLTFMNFQPRFKDVYIPRPDGYDAIQVIFIPLVLSDGTIFDLRSQLSFEYLMTISCRLNKKDRKMFNTVHNEIKAVNFRQIVFEKCLGLGCTIDKETFELYEGTILSQRDIMLRNLFRDVNESSLCEKMKIFIYIFAKHYATIAFEF